ncbi:MAG: serine/threonine-protein kinase [Deltaproteobacteria bacterium]|nr:serine/threonine-protein kinase [Deltaproteobacteria bacterium]
MDALASTEVPLVPSNEAFEDYNLASNLRRLRPVMLALLATHLVVGELVYGTPRTDPSENFRNAIQTLHRVGWIADLVFLGAHFGLSKRPKGSRLGQQALVSAGMLFYMAFGALVSANAQRLNGNINTFVAVCFGTGVAVCLPVAHSVAIYLLGYVILAAGVLVVGIEPALQTAAFVNGLGAAAMGLVVAQLHRREVRKLFNTTHLAERQAAQLTAQREAIETLNTKLEQRVRSQVQEIVARAAEIDLLNAHLRERVVDQSRQLRRLLSASGEFHGDEVLVGSIIDDRFEVISNLGRGGAGDVFLAFDRTASHRVALKMVRTDKHSAKENLARFAAEAETAASVQHPAIVKPLHVGVTETGRLYLTMEYVDGLSLADAIGQRKLSLSEALAVFAILSDALSAAHDAALVHRDIKPSNILLAERAPGAFLVDFGISKRILSDGSSQHQTDENVVLGTPQYMPPEQMLDPHSVTSSADIYALGLALSEALTGAPPHAGGGLEQIMLSRLTVGATPLSPDDFPKALCELHRRMLHRMPEARPSAREVGNALRDIAHLSEHQASCVASSIVTTLQRPHIDGDPQQSKPTLHENNSESSRQTG